MFFREIRRLFINKKRIIRKKSKTLNLNIGRPYDMKVSPKADQLAITNHRNELLLIDLKKSTICVGCLLIILDIL